MILKMYTVLDGKVEAYLPPFYAPTRGSALRTWNDTVNDPNHQFNKHPEDYTLYEIGEYDDKTADVRMQDPISLGRASDIKENRI